VVDSRTLPRLWLASLFLHLSACNQLGLGSEEQPSDGPTPAASPAASAEVPTNADADDGRPASAAEPTAPTEAEPTAAAPGSSAASGDGTPSATAGAAAPASASPPRLVRVLAGKKPRLHPLADGTLLLSIGPQIYVVESGKPLVEDPALRAGLPYPLSERDGVPSQWLWDLDVTGRWPDAVFASIWLAAPPNTEAVARPSFRRRDGRFSPLSLGGRTHRFYYVDGRPYVDGSILSLRRFQPLPPPGVQMGECHEDDPPKVRKCDARFAEVERIATTSKPLVVTRGLPKGPDLEALLGVPPPPLAEFDALGSGHVFAATQERRARMLVVTPRDATLHDLPGASKWLRIRAIRALAPNLVFVAGNSDDPFMESKPRLYRYDGRTWTELPAPPCPEYAELWSFERLVGGDHVALCVMPLEEDDGFSEEPKPLWWQAPGQDWVALDIEASTLALHGPYIWATNVEGAYTNEPMGPELHATSRDELDRLVLREGPEPLALFDRW